MNQVLLLACLIAQGDSPTTTVETIVEDVGIAAVAVECAAVENRSTPCVRAAASQAYDHGNPTATEQLMMELVNRARANPGAEAARLGIDLNAGLEPGTITNTWKQPLAFNPHLLAAARGHSQWMLDTDTFEHTGINGSSFFDRMQVAGYEFVRPWTCSENLGYRGTTGTLDVNSFTAIVHDNVFKSPGHRQNICNEKFDELGIGAVEGQFTSGGNILNTVMITQDFARSGSTPGPMCLGVVYQDANTNGFYDPGEGVPNITVRPASGAWHAVTSDSGGYAFPYESGSGALSVTFSGDPIAIPYTTSFQRSEWNVKLDVELAQTILLGFVEGTMRWTAEGGFQALVSGRPGSTVILQHSTDLAHWTDVATIPLESGAATVTHTGTPNTSLNVYRLKYPSN